MDNIASLDRKTSASSAHPPAAASGELAKLETQLSDWVHCASSKTSDGKAKIAEITAKIDAIKGQVKKAEETKHSVASHAEPKRVNDVAVRGLRFDGLGTWLNVQA